MCVCVLGELLYLCVFLIIWSGHVCICVFLCVFVYWCTGVCVCARASVRVCKCVDKALKCCVANFNKQTHTQIHTHSHTRTHVQTRGHTHANTNTYERSHAHTHIHTPFPLCIYIHTGGACPGLCLCANQFSGMQGPLDPFCNDLSPDPYTCTCTPAAPDK